MKGFGLRLKRKYFSPADLLIIALVLVFVLLGAFRLFAPKETEGLVAVVKVRGEVTERIPLDKVQKAYELSVEGDCSVLIGISPEGVRFVNSECPDLLCVNTGVLCYAGQSAVCLPAGVSLTLESVSGAGDSVPDAIVG
ncbi:MAG: NusG domain II-containing protein [Ruminococcus sp.]|nr:NusG domain II-containing protein [Ruminococcus sp.]